jgi:hypothetical protein
MVPMRNEWIAALAVMLPAAAPTQDITQRPIRTERISGVPVGVGLFEVAPDGTVLIDWRTVEAAAKGPADRASTPVAKAMLAIGDGK